MRTEGAAAAYRGYCARSIDRIGAHALCMYYGSEFISKAMDRWAYENGVELDFSRPGKPTDNAKVESFNGRFRSECLNAHWFSSLDDATRKIEAWRQYYNEVRPHSALDWATPAEYARRMRKAAQLHVSPKPEIPKSDRD